MKLLVSQAPEKGWLSGPKYKLFSVSFQGIDYEIEIEQCLERKITISQLQNDTYHNLLSVLYSLITLLMLFDGQFYEYNRVLENNQEITSSFRHRALASYKSADFMVGSGNILIDYEDVLSSALLKGWIDLKEELDMIHNMVLYCLSNVQMPVDMKCAFMIEAFLGLCELVKEHKPDFSLPTIHKGDSKLQKYLCAIIEHYGHNIFYMESHRSKEQFAQVLTDSRNRIAHIKKKQERLFLNGDESVLYLSKLSLVYRVILFDLLGISEVYYNSKLNAKTDTLNQWNGVLHKFMEKPWPQK
jgi:hypothetical protein